MNSRGQDAEALAAAFLEQNGLRILERNYRSRFGEIDLIASDGETVVFVEVRERNSEAYGGAAASITLTKQKKLTRTALAYLGNNARPPVCRFDAVLISKSAKIEWLRDAFQTM
jgi:putative endonuclease